MSDFKAVDDELAFIRINVKHIFLICFGAMIVGLLAVALNLAVANTGCLADVSGCDNLLDSFRLMEPRVAPIKLCIGRNLYLLLTTPLAGLFVYLFTEKLIRGEDTRIQLRGGGTRQSLMATARGTGIHFKCAIYRIILSIVYLGSGAGSLGLEGPIIHISASTLTSLAYWTKREHLPRSKERYRMVLYAAVGTASGVCAAFRCPIGGVTFAMEELGHISPKHLTRGEFLLISLASVVASTMTRVISYRRGVLLNPWDTRHYVEVQWKFIQEWDIQQYAVLMVSAIIVGFLGALTGHCFSCLHCKLDEIVAVQTRIPGFLVLPLSAVVVSLLGWVCDWHNMQGINGLGEETLVAMFSETNYSFGVILLVFVAKFMATIVSAALGGPGGMFGPSLIIGCILGRCTAMLLQYADERIDHKPLVIFGMASMFTTIFRLPLTAMVIPQELCGASHLTPPLMLANYVAASVSAMLAKDSLFERLLQQDGVNLKHMHSHIRRDSFEHNVWRLQDIPASGVRHPIRAHSARDARSWKDECPLPFPGVPFKLGEQRSESPRVRESEMGIPSPPRMSQRTSITSIHSDIHKETALPTIELPVELENQRDADV